MKLKPYVKLSLTGSIAENRDIDPILSKALGALGHVERFQPICHLLHLARLRQLNYG